MAVNVGLAQVSSDFMIAALLIYSLAVLGFAGDFAFGGRAGGVRGQRASGRTRGCRGAGRRRVGASGRCGGVRSARRARPDRVVARVLAGGSASVGGGAVPVLPPRKVPALRAIWEAGPWVRAGMTFSVVGLLAHVIAVVTRGLAVHRAPWGNMYEFVTALTCVAVMFFVAS